MYYKLLFILLVIPCLATAGQAQPHHTTAFIGTPGTLDTLWSASTYSTNSFWNENGEKLPTFNNFKQYSYLLYAECALPYRNSITFNGGFTQVRESINGPSRGLEDVEIGWKHQLYTTRDSALTSQLVGIFPAGPKISSVRYGSFGLLVSALYSKIFRIKNVCAWVDLDLGYRWYKEAPTDQIDAGAALGLVLRRGVWLIASNELNYGLNHGETDGILNNVTLNPNYRLYKGKIECVFKVFTHTYISLGAYKHFWGRNVGTGGGYYGGVWLVF